MRDNLASIVVGQNTVMTQARLLLFFNDVPPGISYLRRIIYIHRHMLEGVSACCCREWPQVTLAVAGGRKRVEEGRVRDGGGGEGETFKRWLVEGRA